MLAAGVTSPTISQQFLIMRLRNGTSSAFPLEQRLSLVLCGIERKELSKKLDSWEKTFLPQ